MSHEVDTAWVRQYEDAVRHLVQQNGSKLRPYVTETTLEGELKFTEQVGSVEWVQRTTRHGDTPLVDTPHRRRALQGEDWHISDLVDSPDQLRARITLGSAYMEAQRRGLGRRIDRILVTALGASALTGKLGTSTTALPATQILQSTSTETANSGGSARNLDLATLRRAQKLILDANADDEMWVLAAGSSQRQSLLKSTKATSSDYNAVKALVNGEIDTWMGFKFVWIGGDILPVASNIRDCYAFCASGIEMAIGGLKSRIAEDPGKNFSTRIYAEATIGATRLEEERVIKIQCDETVMSATE